MTITQSWARGHAHGTCETDCAHCADEPCRACRTQDHAQDPGAAIDSILDAILQTRDSIAMACDQAQAEWDDARREKETLREALAREDYSGAAAILERLNDASEEGNLWAAYATLDTTHLDSLIQQATELMAPAPTFVVEPMPADVELAKRELDEYHTFDAAPTWRGDDGPSRVAYRRYEDLRGRYRANLETLADWWIEPAHSGPMNVAAVDLLAALKRVKPGVQSRATIPVLSGVLFNGATLTTADFANMITVSTTAPASGGIEIVAPLALLEKVLSKFPKSAEVALSTHKTALTVTSGARSFTIDSWPASEFPSAMTTDARPDVQPVPFWRDAWTRVEPCLSRDTTRPLLCGFRTDGQTIVATDSYRLGIYRVPDADNVSLPALTVPARTGDIVAKLKGAVSYGTIGAQADTVVKCGTCAGSGQRTHREYGGYGGAVQTTVCPVCKGLGTVLESHEGSAAFVVDHGAGITTTVVARPMEGQYPNWRQLVRETNTAEPTIDRAALAEAVDAVSVLAEKNTPVRLTFTVDNTLTVRVLSQDVGTAEESLSIDWPDEADAVTIGFSPDYLVDGLNAFTCDRVKVGLSGALQPALMTDASDNGSGHRFTYLLMPIRLAS